MERGVVIGGWKGGGFGGRSGKGAEGVASGVGVALNVLIKVLPDAVPWAVPLIFGGTAKATRPALTPPSPPAPALSSPSCIPSSSPPYLLHPHPSSSASLFFLLAFPSSPSFLPSVSSLLFLCIPLCSSLLPPMGFDLSWVASVSAFP